MAVNTRFATGVHALSLLASEPDVLQTSDDVAGKLNTSPVVIRRVFSLLHQAGLVASQKGPSGGYMLARNPARITMADVVDIIEGGYCPVECLEDAGASVCPRGEPCAMRDVWREVRDSVIGSLRGATIQSLADRRKSALMYQI